MGKNGQNMGKNGQKMSKSGHFAPSKCPFRAVPSPEKCRAQRSSMLRCHRSPRANCRAKKPARRPALSPKSTEFGPQKHRAWAPKAPSLGPKSAEFGPQKRRAWVPKAPALGPKSTELGDQKHRVWVPKAPSLGLPEGCIAPASMAPRPCRYRTSTLLVWHYHIVPSEVTTSRFRSGHLEVRY